MNSPKVIQYCSKATYVSFILVPFFASFSSALVNLCIGVAIFGFLLKKVLLRERVFKEKNPILIPFFFIVIVSFLSFENSLNLRASLQGIGKLVKYLALVVLLIEELKDVTHAKRIVTGVLLGLLLASGDGLCQLYTGFDFIRHRTVMLMMHDPELPSTLQINVPRMTAAFFHPNMFGIYLGLFLPLSIAVTLYAYQGRQKAFGFAASILALFCLLSTFSRGSFAGFLAALFFIAAMKKDKVLLGSLILMIAMIPFILPHDIKEWAGTKPTIWEFLLNTKRIGDWRNALNMIRHHPFLGVGVNTYTLNFEKYKLRDASRFVSDTGWSHNSYLQMAAEIGVFGPLLFFWLIFRLFRSGLRSCRSLEDPFLKAAALGIMGGIIAYLVNGITETALYYSKMVSLFWIQVGFLLAMPHVTGRLQKRRL